MTKQASSSIKAGFSPSPNKKPGFQFDLSGRGTSVLGKFQGDHVTAYGLVEAGFHRIIGSLTQAEFDELFRLENRDSLRERRGRIYDFVSAIAVLDDEMKTDSFYQRIDTLLKEYNEARISKTTIREETRRVQEDPEIIGEPLSLALQGIEAKYGKNGAALRHLLTEITRLTLTFYNHIPHTAYFPIAGFEASSDEGSTIRTSLPKIEEIISSSKELERGSPALSAKLRDNLIPAIVSLIHYPEITDEDALGEHREITLTRGGRSAQPRDNKHGKLLDAMAKHLHVVLAVYPELEEIFDTKDIVSFFVAKFIGGKDGKGLMGWPSLNTETKLNKITTLVTTKMQTLKEASSDRHYTSYKEYDDLVSSGDEEESTSPRVKLKAASATKLETSKELSAAERAELEMLRKFKEMVVSGEEIELSFTAKEKLKSQFPDVFKSKGEQERS